MYNIQDYLSALKCDLPCLQYDIASYCSQLNKRLPFAFPYGTEPLEDKIRDYSKQADQVIPQNFPDAYRIYIIDEQLNLMFAALDQTGEIATYLSKYAAHSVIRPSAVFGLSTEFYTESGDRYRKSVVQSFCNRYGFLPCEEIVFSRYLIFDGDQIAEDRQITTYQVAYFLAYFNKINLVDWTRRFVQMEDMPSLWGSPVE